MLCSKIIENVNSIINDPAMLRSRYQEKIDVLNDAIRAVILVRQNLLLCITPHSIQDDTKQTLPNDCFRLLKSY